MMLFTLDSRDITEVSLPMKPFALLIMAVCLPAQQIVTTFAGTDWVFPSNGKALTDAAISRNLNLAADARGVIYAVDSNSHVVLRLENSGSVTVVAGNGVAGFSGDGGPATRAGVIPNRIVSVVCQSVRFHSHTICPVS